MTRIVVWTRGGGSQPAVEDGNVMAADTTGEPHRVVPCRSGMTALDAHRLDVNLLDGDLYAGDPTAVYRRLRDEAPVYRDRIQGIWGISRYDDVVAVEKDTARYTSSHGSRPRIVGDVSMINNDDPLHQSKRRLVARRFTPRSVKQHEDQVRRIVTDLIDAVAPAGGCDVVADLAAPLPARVICEMLGFDPSLADKCREWSEVTMLSGGQYHADGAAHEASDATINAVLEFGPRRSMSSPSDEPIPVTICSPCGRTPISSCPTARAG